MLCPAPRSAYSSCRDTRAQREAVDKLSGYELYAIRLPDLMNGDNVWMIECRSRPSFLFKSSRPLVISCEAGRQQLESYTAVQSRILCQINFTRPARAEQGHNLVQDQWPAPPWTQVDGLRENGKLP